MTDQSLIYWTAVRTDGDPELIFHLPDLCETVAWSAREGHGTADLMWVMEMVARHGLVPKDEAEKMLDDYMRRYAEPPEQKDRYRYVDDLTVLA